MRFRRKSGATTWDRMFTPLAPRSAYRLSGPARSEWEHSITPMDVLRYSVTFRTLAKDDPRR
jgi:alkylated DNA repair dioxygenase AlkB